MKLPMELRGPGKVKMSDVVDALIDHQILQHAPYVYPHDGKGWMITCPTTEVAKNAAGKHLTILKYDLSVALYQTGGSRTFVTNHTNSNSAERVAREIAGIKQVMEKELSF